MTTAIPRHSLHAFDVAAFAHDRLGFTPGPDQLPALDPFARRGILNCCRQWGKSTTIALRAVHHALHEPHSLGVIASPSARQSAEFVRKAKAFLRRLALPIRGDGDNEISLVFPNGSRIVGLPGQEGTIRGFSNVSLLLIDEASRVPDSLYHALRPMTATHADASIWLMSTPNGRQGFFYEVWTAGGPQWTRIEAPATRCPRIFPEFLADEERCLPNEVFRQEYLCEFTTADHTYFDPAAIDDAFDYADEAAA